MVKEFKSFDAIIIGAGQGGSPLATTLAKAGWQVALIEKKYVGGSCINTGCTPTKTMIASAKIAHIVRKANKYGINAKLELVSIPKIIRRKQEIVESFRDGSRNQLLSTKGLSLIEGEASFVGKKQLQITFPDKETIYAKADTIVVNTGTEPFIPSIPGLFKSNYLDSASIMEIEALPDHLVILGGGYVGLEFGQMFKRFGSKVSIIQINKQLLPREDSDIAQELTKILKQEGIEVFLGTTTLEVKSISGSLIQLNLQQSKRQFTIEGTHLLIATGRQPSTSALNLPETGITVNEQGFIPVNDHLETEVPGIFAIGDVNGGPQFTHISYDDYRILKRILLKGEKATISGRMLPYVVFTDPQLGRIGLSENEAKKSGLDYQVAKMPMSWVSRAIETSETAGIMKAIVNNKTSRILGAAILGPEGGELMAILQVAMLGDLPYTILRDAIFSHPSLSESLNTLFEMINLE